MTFTRTLLGAALVLGLTAGTGFAQSTPAPATTAPAATAPAAPAMGAAADKKKMASKACSDEATAKGLHGKERKSFRSKCKMDKMKGM